MTPNIKILISGLLVFLFSCGHSNDKKKIATVFVDTLRLRLEKEENERKERRKAMELEDKIDSINFDKILKDAITVADQSINFKKFKNRFVVWMPDSAYQVEVTLSSDFYFTKENTHLIVRRTAPGFIYIDIFIKQGNQFQKVLTHKQWSLTYENDTIQDINGDRINDFVVNWYGSSGCCLKAFSNVYLFRPDKNTFSNSFEFINPTFSPKEHVIRGVCYGHPSETEMYKYKWNGETLDTLEYISYEKNEKGDKTGKIIVSNYKPYSEHCKVLKRLNSVPKEYKKIYGYDWFTGKGYE